MRSLVLVHQPRTDPVVRAGAPRPQRRGKAVLLGLGGLVRVRGRAAEALPRRWEHLVVAGGARAVGREVLAARLALDDRPRDRPRAAGTGRGRARGGLALGDQLVQLALGSGAARAGAGQRLGASSADAREGG